MSGQTKSGSRRRTTSTKSSMPKGNRRRASTTGRSTRARKPSRGPARRKKRGRPRIRFWRWICLLALASGGVLAWLIWPFWKLAGQFHSVPVEQPSRLYGRPATLEIGDVATVEALVGRLEELAYARVETPGEMVSGSFRPESGWVEVYRRSFPSAEGPAGGNLLRVFFEDGRIRSLRADGRNVSSALLDPPLVASFYGPDLKERRPFSSIDAELPEDLILSVLAIEDSGFLSHVGISVTGALRAAWTNLMEKQVRQGGSTLTQQLVKNLFLTHERTWTRKVREAVLALFLELRYDKRQIFRAYLNEIFWGRSGPVNLMGVGAAAWAYFGKEPAYLTLAESALLAGMIQSPAHYSPLTAPERARQRRNQVLERLAQLQWVERDRLERAAREPVVVRQGPMVARRAPYFADAAAEEARRRFGIDELRDAGYVLVSTLAYADQVEAEEAVEKGVAEVASRWEKGNERSLQAALVSVDPADGALLAYVGGRDYATSQFDRVSKARRQPGSAFKPVVYAAAIGEHAATPASVLDDAPFEVSFDGELWSPKNSDGQYHGRVSVRNALERSLNVPTAQLALRTGLGPVIDLAHGMGIRGRIAPFPALALGTMDATPLEMATVYATLAAGGVRPSLHALEAVYDRDGRRLEGKAPPPPERVVDEDVAFLINYALQGVLERGTGRGARREGVHDPVAGKTGTSNDRRDSWFAGYSPDRATLVWVGYDDNSTTRLSGARAALPIWARFTRAVRPPGGFRGFTAPSGVVGAWIDPETGGLATTRCPRAAAEFFLREFPPGELCPLHDGWRSRPLPQPEGIEIEPRRKKRHRFQDWLEMVRRQRGRG